MDNIELMHVEASTPLIRSFDPSDQSFRAETIETDFGSILVAQQGVDHRKNPSKPVILTYPDLGLNNITNFQAFFNFSDMKLLLDSFSVLHVNPPGQEEGAASLPEGFIYPTMDQLADQLVTVCQHYEVKSIIGLGVGLGANVLARFALKHADQVDGLFLINATASQSSWTEWFYQKVNMYYLGGVAASLTGIFPQATQDYLMWHHFGRVDSDRNYDLIQVYRNHFSGKNLNSRNLSLLIDSYIKRTDLGLVRGNTENNIKCPTLIMTGHYAPHIDDTVDFNGRLNPSLCTWMKLQDCGMVLEEQPAKVVEALRLFIQGLGYSLSSFDRRRTSRANSMSSQASTEQGVHIVENPMTN